MAEENIKALPEKDREPAAMKAAVHDFLELEMNFNKEDINNIKNEKIYSPRYGDNQVLYCPFATPPQRAQVTAKSDLLLPNEEDDRLTP